MVTMLLLGGIILFTIGVLGIYVGKIHSAIKNRPSYIIESLVGLPEKDER
jgi:dolichol-phosphate mannosyltransferase